MAHSLATLEANNEVKLSDNAASNKSKRHTDLGRPKEERYSKEPASLDNWTIDAESERRPLCMRKFTGNYIILVEE